MKLIIIIEIILILYSVDVFGQKENFEELQSLPINKELDLKTLQKFFYKNTDTTENQMPTFRYMIESKHLNESENIMTLVLVIQTGVCVHAYLYSFNLRNEIIESKSIEETCDNGDLLGPDYDYTYIIDNNTAIIQHRVLTPCEPTTEEPYKTHIKTEYKTYVKLREDGFFFELHQINPSTKNRIYPYVSNRPLNINELQELTMDELSIMRNEIFASHGYIFKTKKFEAYFNEQEWYEPLSSEVDDILNEIEKKNIQLIKEFEKGNYGL
jgi:hypothetical protein